MGFQMFNPEPNLKKAAEHNKKINVENLAEENQLLRSDINSLSIALAEMLGGGE